MLEQSATKLSANIIVHFRLHRSTKTPAKGPNTTWGKSAAIVANESTSAEPVSRLIHRTMANWAAGSTGGFDIYKVVEAYFTDLEKRKEINDLLGISEPCETRVTEECFS